jgi:hypothetical protein
VLYSDHEGEDYGQLVTFLSVDIVGLLAALSIWTASFSLLL